MSEQERMEIAALLREIEALSLSFDIGTAYIRRAFIDRQNELCTRVDAAVKLLTEGIAS